MINLSFNFLKGDSDFLNTILNNISSCVLMLNKELELTAFNDSLRTIFSNKKDEDLMYVKCGEAIGCAYQIEEQKICGTTTKCNTCELKKASLYSYLTNEPVFKEHITKPFFDYENNKVDKHLQFSTRVFKHNTDKHIIMIIDDITDFINLRNKNN